MNIQKFMLIIMDGWGIGNHSKSDAIYNGSTPNLDKLLKAYPNSRLKACGEDVGLPDGQMGNSEVGHLNIGAGRVVYQELVRINKAVESNSIDKNPTLCAAFEYAQQNKKNVHLLGLVSNGGVHSHIKHLFKLCDLSGNYDIPNTFIHILTDGRDTDPQSGYGFVEQLVNHLKKSNGTIASLCGRYYTMDRDKRWERVKQGYDLLVHGTGKPSANILESIREWYNEGITDEFIKPTVMVDQQGNPLGKVQEGDVFICFNFRTDRLREITMVLSQSDMPEYEMKTLPLHYLTMTRYDDHFKNVNIIYDNDNVSNTLGEVVSKHNLKQLRIAETEKYAHVTFFFSGGREETFPGESRILIPSPKVATYDLKPEMSAYEVKNAIVEELKKEKHDFICLNFANGDMVGHTGIYPAILKAVEAVDTCVGEVIDTAVKHGYEALIIADHGNADNAINPDGSPNTAHSLNPVPSILISNRFKHINPGILADVAPTILYAMGIDIPEEMTGHVLIEN